MRQSEIRMMEECARHCHECVDACLVTLVHCLEIGGEYASHRHQTLLTDCATICSLAHNLLQRRSAQHPHTCRACAEICEACAEACGRLGAADRVMQQCAQSCRRCASSCQAMTPAAP